MRALALLKWTMLGLIFGTLVVACGDKDDNKKKTSSFVEINRICFDRDRERETSESQCRREDSPRYYTENGRCYNWDNDDAVNDRECDLYYDAYEYGTGYGFNNTGVRDVRCDTTRVYDSFMREINCASFSCRGGLYYDISGFPVRCL